jgi:DNA invertase Pin-like site-specific DNA recombinase
MSGQNVGYVRVSTIVQNTARQLDGILLDRTFEDKASGKDTKRPQLQACLKHLREGDTLHVHSLDRLGRNLDDLRKIVWDLVSRGVVVHSHKESLIFTGNDNAMAKFLLSVMGALAEFERGLSKERQAEGIALAKARGAYKGRKPSLGVDRVKELLARIQAGSKIAHLAREFGVTRETIYQYKRSAAAATECA